MRWSWLDLSYKTRCVSALASCFFEVFLPKAISFDFSMIFISSKNSHGNFLLQSIFMKNVWNHMAINKQIAN